MIKFNAFTQEHVQKAKNIVFSLYFCMYLGVYSLKTTIATRIMIKHLIELVHTCQFNVKQAH